MRGARKKQAALTSFAHSTRARPARLMLCISSTSCPPLLAAREDPAARLRGVGLSPVMRLRLRSRVLRSRRRVRLAAVFSV